MSDENLEGLSPEELEALKDDDTAPGDEVQPPPEAKPDDEPPPTTTEAEPPPETKPAEAGPATAPPPAPEPPKPAFVPVLQVDKQALEAAKAQADEAKKKWQDGDIDYDEYLAVVRKADRLEAKAEIAEELQANAATAGWVEAQRRFFADNPAYADPVASRLFSEFVNSAFIDPAGANYAEGAALSDDAMLARAKQEFEKSLSPVLGGKSGDNGRRTMDALAAAKAAQAGKQPPTTLRDAPSAHDDFGSGTDQRFDALDRLAETDPDRYQMEIDRLPEDVQREYARYTR
jgi:hypothetical protein